MRGMKISVVEGITFSERLNLNILERQFWAPVYGFAKNANFRKPINLHFAETDKLIEPIILDNLGSMKVSLRYF